LTCEFAPAMLNVTGVPVGTLTLVKVAEKVCVLPSAGSGVTVAGVRLSAGAGFVGTKPQVPSAAVSLKTVSPRAVYRQPSGPVEPDPTLSPAISSVFV